MKTILSITTFLFLGLTNVKAQSETDLELDNCFKMPEKVLIETEVLDIRPTVECEISDYKIVIYDGLGNLVFESTDVLEYWNVKDLPAGTYSWKVTANRANSVPLLSLKEEGNILIIE